VNLKKRRSGILIVDDLSFMRTAIRDILQNDGISVAGEAENGRRCLEFYYRHPVELVLMDITMPEMDGIEALYRLMRLDKNAKVVMCSAMGQEKYILRAIQLGAKDFIVKPFKSERVISAVRKASGLNEE
jgi:two-component system chemotaxis response regulator CheY